MILAWMGIVETLASIGATREPARQLCGRLSRSYNGVIKNQALTNTVLKNKDGGFQTYPGGRRRAGVAS